MPESDDLAFRDQTRECPVHHQGCRWLLNQTESGITRAVAEESENFLERQYGRVFIAIDTPFTYDAYDVGEVMIDTFQREFFGDLNRTPGLVRARAHVINQTLADLAVEGESEWVGKLHAGTGVIDENQILFVTASGRAKAYLIRGHLTDITEGLSEDSSQTAKTFVNVVEGALEVGDKVSATSTPELLSRFPIATCAGRSSCIRRLKRSRN